MNFDPLFRRRRRINRRLLRETLTSMVVVSTLIILLVLAASLSVVSQFLNADLIRRSVTTADEMAAVLEDPLYNVDELQAVRFAEVMLTSGRISGIRLDSVASGALLIKDYPGRPSRVPQLTRSIVSNGILVGTIHLWFDDAEVDRAQTLLFSLALVLVAAVAGASFLAHRFIIRPKVERPFASIGSGITAISRGRYDQPVPETPYQDVNLIVRLINRMARKISAHSEELSQANALLERKVQERTAELKASLDDLRRTQGRLVESERLSAVGQLAAGMAHQFNTPLGAIISANRTVLEFHQDRFRQLLKKVFGWTDAQRTRFLVLLDYEAEVNRTDPPRPERRELRALVQRLQGLGVVDPEAVADLLAELRLVSLPDHKADLASDPDLPAFLETLYEQAAARDMAQVVAMAGEKAATVLSALGNYLSPQSVGQTSEVHVERDLESVLTLVKGQIGRSVTVERRFAGVVAWGSSTSLSQVWMNLINNALQAMRHTGTLRLETSRVKGRVIVRVIDSGEGIPEANLERIFDPFFTTKVRGEGLGLGLDICRKIVHSCGGNIVVESRPGRTCFTIDLPGAPS